MKPALILVAAAFLISAFTPTFNAQSTGLVCNSSPRTCLDLMLNSYLKALLIHKPETLPVTENVKFTENGVALKLGEGLWQTITKFNVEECCTKQEFIDLPQGTAALHMIAMEGKSPAVFILRIKVSVGKITEAETHVIRSHPDGTRLDLSGLHGLSLPMYLATKQLHLHSRAELIRISERYLEAQRLGSFNAADSTVAVDAYRTENGRTTARGPYPSLTWRIEAIDEDLGLVWVREDFGGRLAWEGLKIYDSQIHAIEGFSGI